MKKKQCAVFISGRGSNLESLIKESKEQNFPVEIKLIISDNLDAKGLIFSEIYNIESFPINFINYENHQKFEETIIQILKDKKIEIVCLAGFMRILSPFFINSFSGPILNIHPSLLPKYKGLNTHQRALDNNDTIAGCTVHFVNESIDSGKIILQKTLNINDDETADSLQKRVLKLEHQAYPEAIKQIFN